MENITDLKDAVDNLKIEEDDVNVISQMSDHEERDCETKMVTEGAKNGDSVLMVFKKRRDEALIEFNCVRRELDDIQKKCFMINKLKEKAIKDIYDHRVQIASPNLLKADLEQLQRFKSLVIEKESVMITLACLKKQAVIFLALQLAIQDKQLRLVMDITEKQKMLSLFIHQFKIAELQQNSDSENACKIRINMEFIKHEKSDFTNKLMQFNEEIMRDQVSFLLMYDELHKQLEDMSKNKNHSVETMEFLENEVKNLNLSKKNFEIYVTTFNKEIDLAVEAHFQLSRHGLQLLENSSKKPTND